MSYRRGPRSPLAIPSRTFSYVSFRGPVPESRWIDLRVRAPYVSPADCVLAASCASLGFIPAQAGIGAIQCERTRATPEQSYFLLLWVKIGRLRNTKITGAGWSPLSHRDIIILHHDLDSGTGPRNDKGGGIRHYLHHNLDSGTGPRNDNKVM